MSHIMHDMDDTHTTSRLYSTSVVVVSYNTAAHIESCLLSLLELDYPQVEIIVVDNGSTDGSVDVIRQRFPDVELVELQENKGFAGGASVGLYMASGDIVATVNPDVKLDPDWMLVVVDTLMSDEDVGIVGSKILRSDNGSTDGSVDVIRQRFPDVELVELQENKGFAGGASVGLYMASGDIVATVNPDVKLDPDWMLVVVDTLMSDEDVGIVGSKIL